MRTGFLTREAALNLYPLLVDRSFVGPMGFICLCTFIEACILNDKVEFDNTAVKGFPLTAGEPINVTEAIENCQTFQQLIAAKVLIGVDFERRVSSVATPIERWPGSYYSLADKFSDSYGNKHVSYLSGFTAKADFECTRSYIALHNHTNEAFNRVDLAPGLFINHPGSNPEITPETFSEYPLMEQVGLDFIFTMCGRISDFNCVGLASDLIPLHAFVSPLEMPHYIVRARSINDLSEWVHEQLSRKLGLELKEIGVPSFPVSVPIIATSIISACKGDMSKLATVILEYRERLSDIRSFNNRIEQLDLVPSNAKQMRELQAELDRAWAVLPTHNSPREKVIYYGTWWFSHLVAMLVAPGFTFETIASKALDLISQNLGQLPKRSMNKIVSAYVETFAEIDRDFDFRRALAAMGAEVAPEANWKSMRLLLDLNYSLAPPIKPQFGLARMER
jgi:hypothetical protein